MSQISPPIRILLVCAVAFMAAWMLFLKPSDAVVAEPAATTPPNVASSEPAVSRPGQVVESAQEAVDAGATQAQAQETPPAAPAAPAPKAATDLEDVPKPVARAIRKEKALVLLFWNPKSADDRAVRAELRDVNRWDGRVHVRAARLADVSKYGRITRGVDVAQSPTVVVVDPELHAETIVGYTDTQAVDQLVLDALRNTTGMFTSSYLREINGVCARFADSVWALPDPRNGRQFVGYVGDARGRLAAFTRDVRAIQAPKRFAGLRSAFLADLAALSALYGQWAASLGSSNPGAARILASADRFGGRERAINRRINRRMDARNVLACGRQS